MERIVINMLIVAVEPPDICACGDLKAIVLGKRRSTVSKISATRADSP
jgi:hypothetical protein